MLFEIMESYAFIRIGSFFKGECPMRIDNHPILGRPVKGRPVAFQFDGKEYHGYEGEPIAVALKYAGVMVHRYTTKRHAPRGIFCAIGRCTDCVMVVDGMPNIRTCVTPLKEGMVVQTQDGVTAKNQEEDAQNGTI
jgi:predicted molibdopterin-dependent oxidoreductase YjgC